VKVHVNACGIAGEKIKSRWCSLGKSTTGSPKMQYHPTENRLEL
jgi:hypothetical protein